jgi:cell division protein FtsN
MIDLILAAADSGQPLITESFLKWVVGGMGGAIGVLAKYTKSLIDQRNSYLEEQVDNADKSRAAIEEEVRNRFLPVISDKDEEIKRLESEVDKLTEEKIKFLKAQIEDAKQQDKGLVEVTEDYKNLIDGHLLPVLRSNIDVLEYYKQKRERQKPK